jgi:hypothetical protein
MNSALAIRRRTITDAVVGVGFILLFPGFALYHDLVGRSLIPRFLGGFFSWVALGLLVVLLWPGLKRLLSKSLLSEPFARIVLSLLFYLGSVLLLNFATGETEGDQAAVYQAAKVLMLWIALILTGMMLPMRAAWLRKIMWMACTAAVIGLAIYVASTGQPMYYARSFAQIDGIATYQGYARSALVVLFFLAACARPGWQVLFVSLSGSFVLFVLGARSEFFAFLMILPIYQLLLCVRSTRLLVIFSLFVASLSIAIMSYWDWLIQSRQLQVLNLEGASSWIARMAALERALSMIAANPILGDFGAHVTETGSTGRYAHNIFSAWVSYGLFGFIIISVASFWAMIGSAFRVLRGNGRDSLAGFSFMVNASVVVLLAVAKSIFWVVPGLGWGLYLALLLRADREVRSLKQQ